MSNIIAITLGPIYRTTSNVKSTKALWASSYFFSYLAKNIIAPFKERNFILPIVNDIQLWQSLDGIGRFPDRFIFHAQKEDFEKLKQHVQVVIKNIAKQMTPFFISNNEDTDNLDKQQRQIETFLTNYLKIYFFEKEFTETENIVDGCNSILDLIEYEDSYNLMESENYLTCFFEHNKLWQSFLVQDAFGDNGTYQLFEALDQISNPDEEKKMWAYQNYIAIISADGDNMSDTIKLLLEKEDKTLRYQGADIQELSESLLTFGENVASLTFQKEQGKEQWMYKARIVYLGGDDLLIFAPVMYKGKTVFDFIEKISCVFDNEMNFAINPSLSFGVSINYVKFPMHEALAISQDMLAVAKKNKPPYRNKNSVVFSLQKHSGQTCMGELTKDQDKNIFDAFLKLVTSYNLQGVEKENTEKSNENESEEKKAENKIISSVIYWLANHTNMLKILLDLNEAERRARVKNYFYNSFNESIHNEMRPFYNNLIDFLIMAYKVTDKPIELLQSTLKFIHFINSKRDE